MDYLIQILSKITRPVAAIKSLRFALFTQIRRFQTVTPVWIHQWLQNDAKSLK